MTRTLADAIAAQIRAHGPMDIGAFMAQAGAHYYATRDPFGAQGDFTTAPEVSQMFGEMIGAWLADIWAQMGRPARFSLVECGPGRGTLMADILRVARRVDGFLEAAQVRLIEMSPVLREKQHETLRAYDFIHWHESLEGVPADAPVLILGNEFLDALPVRQFRRGAEGWQERVVCLDGESFRFDFGPPEDALLPLLPAHTVSQEIYEVSPARLDFIRACGRLLKSVGGAALFVDYGYTKRAAGDTVQAVRGHRYADILDAPGESDLTAHVDFASLAQSAESDGMVLFGTVAQGAFLRALGIEQRARALCDGAPARRTDVMTALHRLTAPQEMGDLFKVTGFGYGHDFTPAGF